MCFIRDMFIYFERVIVIVLSIFCLLCWEKNIGKYIAIYIVPVADNC